MNFTGMKQGFSSSWSTTQEEETRQKVGSSNNNSSRKFVQTFRLWRLIDPAEPWVLVDEGSFLGYFDWVPRQCRVGPWSIAAQCYLTVLFYLSALTLAYFVSDVSHPWWSTDFDQLNLNYPRVRSWAWYYNVEASIWMAYVMYLVISGPLSYRAWSTYTIQSWTSLWIRHVLCGLAPFYPWAARWAEYIRFPVACSSTCTFVVWNFAIFPYAYFVALKSEEQKQKFFDFSFSFRLVQIHVFNILFCFLNIYGSSPPRKLEGVDFALAVLSAVLYMAWYLFVLDRVGVHLYPIFSPRVWWLVIPMWTLLLLTYLSIFIFWRAILFPVDEGTG